MLRGTTSSTNPIRSALAARSLFPLRIKSSAALGPDQTGKALTSAGAGDESELDFGQTELRFRVVGSDAIMAGERQLEAAAETGAVDGRDHRFGEGLDAAHQLLALEAQSLRRGACRERRELVDVGAGDEGVRLARDEHGGPDRGFVAESDEQRLELDFDRGTELVHRLAGKIEGDDGDAVLDGCGERRH